MKLLLENWRKYLAESERMEKARAEFKKAVKDGYVGPEISFMDWFKWIYHGYSDKVANWRKNAVTKEKDLKTIYKKNADRNFLDSLTYIHWSMSGDPAKYLTADSKHQTSAEGYAPNSRFRQHFPDNPFNQSRVGIQIRGFVVFGSNANLVSQAGSAYEAQPGKEASGHVKSVGKVADEGENQPGWLDPADPQFSDLVFDEETFSANTGRFKSNNEFIIDNWEPVAIVVLGGRKNKHFDKALQAAQENSLPLIDENQNPIEIERQYETPT